ncbi:helix-turn-helix domain-containing protein [Actinacidiphila sp. ITFR-21]|uniref:helix-turn-helix domain-containing protein n=1 Tax=Actinacidiphila sp. ITFR-21 TaxID=3075199 RepID=UPI00288A1E6C|nr:helix-turn-helix transcriptional regulator [Streptomyces sp. ITFR-21]WNI16437.1 helix-turn-helix transcriptional regulator [Streptomyces sp. ITFR-21]
MTPRSRTRPSRLRQEPEAVTWAREKAGLTKRALADQIGISEQLMGEIESGWRSATPANLVKIAEALNCPIVVLERKRSIGAVGTPAEDAKSADE